MDLLAGLCFWYHIYCPHTRTIPGLWKLTRSMNSLKGLWIYYLVCGPLTIFIVPVLSLMFPYQNVLTLTRSIVNLPGLWTHYQVFRPLTRSMDPFQVYEHFSRSMVSVPNLLSPYQDLLSLTRSMVTLPSLWTCYHVLRPLTKSMDPFPGLWFLYQVYCLHTRTVSFSLTRSMVTLPGLWICYQVFRPPTRSMDPFQVYKLFNRSRVPVPSLLSPYQDF